jgi:hypothetical protein
MKSINNQCWIFLLVLISGCGGSSGGRQTLTGDNVMPITVNGSLCSGNSYYNKPCVSVTVCTPGTSKCQEISDVILDTGSTGLRIFKNLLSVTFTSENVAAGQLGECFQFADGTSEWGPVELANVILGNEPAVQVPIQVIDYSFGTIPGACSNADKTPFDAALNGILGLAPFVQDCGSFCARSANADNGLYYGCNGTSCTGTAVAVSDQVQNPVAFLPDDNNGFLVQLPSVAPSGASSVNGSLILGIGTQSNNSPTGVATYLIDPSSGNTTTTFDGSTYDGILDTGSSGLFFPPGASALPSCPAPKDQWFCPTSAMNLSALNTGALSSTSGTVSFTIANFDDFSSSSNNVSATIGGPMTTTYFDWGLPFHFGRTVYIGIEGTSSSLGQGPYWAY